MVTGLIRSQKVTEEGKEGKREWGVERERGGGSTEMGLGRGRWAKKVSSASGRASGNYETTQA